MEEYYVVNQNGEIIETLEDKDSYVKLNSGDRILTGNSIDYLKKTMLLKYHFIKVNDQLYKKYANKYSILPILMCHVRYLDNVCVHSNGKVITPTMLGKICGLSRPTIYRQLNELLQEDLIHIVKLEGKKSIIVNPCLCYRGKRISVETNREFINSPLREWIEE